MSLSFVQPMVPTAHSHPPRGEGWIHEIKFDGYRTQIIIEAGKVRIFTRRGHDWSAKYHKVADATAELGLTSAIIDGEMVIPDETLRPKFGALRSAITSSPEKLIFMAFDLLHLNGRNCQSEPVETRRALLGELVRPDSQIQFSEALSGDSEALFNAIDRAGLEGMVSKRLGSRYVPGKTTHWLKAKCFSVGVFEIVGVQREHGKPSLALMADQGRYIGSAVIATNREMHERLWARVQARSGGLPPEGQQPGKAEWLKPGLRAQVKYLRGEEHLRHATLQDFADED